MNKRQILIGVAALVVVGGLAFGLMVLRHDEAKPTPPAAVATPAAPVDQPANAATIAAMKKAGPLAGSPLYGVHVEDLPPSGQTFTCAQAQELHDRAAKVPQGARVDEAHETGIFWQGATNPGAYIYYEYQTRLLVVCDGKATGSAILADAGRSAREELVKFDQPHMGDWGHDGKIEFTIFRGECADGPCVGLFHILQLDNGKLKQIAEINADGVETEQLSIGGVSRTSLQIQASCYDTDYTPEFIYLAVLDFGGPNVLTLVPPQQIRLRSPELLQRLSNASVFNPDTSDTQKALGKLQPLIAEAYRGKPLAELQKSYTEILSEIPGLHAGDPAPVQCDPLSILTMISEGK